MNYSVLDIGNITIVGFISVFLCAICVIYFEFLTTADLFCYNLTMLVQFLCVLGFSLFFCQTMLKFALSEFLEC